MMKGYILPFFILFFVIFSAACISSQESPRYPDHSSPATTTPSVDQPSGNLTVYFFDAGTGDSELILTSSGRTMLIDAGDPDNGPVVSAYLKNLRIDTLDAVVASNPGDNKIGGMSEILDTFAVRGFIDSGDTNYMDSYYTPMLSLIRQKNIPYRVVRAGDTISLDPSVTVNVLNPQANMTTSSSKNSVVLKVTYGNISFLFMGDAGGDVENTIAESAGHADILKVGNHGSNISTSAAFLAKVRPEVSVIEGAVEMFGLRSPATLQRLNESGSHVYLTGTHGTVTVTTDGTTYSVTTER